MNSVNFFLNTKVQGVDIATSEKIGNFLLKPAQYLWNGKKIDFIKYTNEENGEIKENIAVQMDLIYRNRSFFKAIVMVVLLVPGLIVGIGFKLYATQKHHINEHDNLIKICLRNNQIGVITTLDGQEGDAFKVEVNTLLNALKVVKNIGENETLFLSDVNLLELSDEYKTENFRDFKAHENNSTILAKIHLLRNLTGLDVKDRYNIDAPRTSFEALGMIKMRKLSITSSTNADMEGRLIKADQFYAAEEK